MSVYAINKLCRDSLHDVVFREALKRDPKTAMAPLDLTGEERTALLAGDVARLYQMGAHPYLLTYLIRYEIFGLTAPIYSERIRSLNN
jgi:hypothetical protein